MPIFSSRKQFNGYPVAVIEDHDDGRPWFEYDVIYIHDPGAMAEVEPRPGYTKRCSNCGSGPRNDLFVVKEHHGSIPKGYLRTLCPDCKDDYAARHADRLTGRR